MKRETNGIIIGLLIIIAVSLLFIGYRLTNKNEYLKILCASDYNDLHHFEDSEQCREDCANYCPTINMKFSRSEGIGNMYNDQLICQEKLGLAIALNNCKCWCE